MEVYVWERCDYIEQCISMVEGCSTDMAGLPESFRQLLCINRKSVGYFFLSMEQESLHEKNVPLLA